MPAFSAPLAAPVPVVTLDRAATALDLAAPERMFISYAQHAEDVLLWRALRGVAEGFYIDAGAGDPVEDSVTLAFYERGWRGINVEPVPAAAGKFPAARPRDVNLRAALSDNAGRLPFYEIEGTGLSTLSQESAGHQQSMGRRVMLHEVEVMTLAEVCRLYAPPVVHFLKVDVEGLEEAVLRGANFHACRPWLVLVEATVPNSTESAHAAWEPRLTSAGYEFLYFDGLNRYYASAEKAAELRPHFQCPPNPMDCYLTHREKSLAGAVQRLEQQLRRMARDLQKVEATAKVCGPRLVHLEAFQKKLLKHFRVAEDAPRPLRAGLKLARFLRKWGPG